VGVVLSIAFFGGGGASFPGVVLCVAFFFWLPHVVCVFLYARAGVCVCVCICVCVCVCVCVPTGDFCLLSSVDTHKLYLARAHAPISTLAPGGCLVWYFVFVGAVACLHNNNNK
jgi:hypothetical protein